MKRVINSMLIGFLMLSMCAFFFTVSMVATGVNTPLSNTIMFISFPIMVALLVWVNYKSE